MKKLFLFLLLILAYALSFAQIHNKRTTTQRLLQPNTSYIQYPVIAGTEGVYSYAGCGTPDTAVVIPVNATKLTTIYLDTCSGVTWQYNPANGGVWDTLSGKGGGSVVNYYANGVGPFQDTIRYLANGHELTVKLYTPGRKITSLTTATRNGSGFSNTWYTDEQGFTNVPYSIGPIDTVYYVLRGYVIDTAVLIQPEPQAVVLESHDILLSWNSIPHATTYLIDVAYGSDYYSPLVQTSDTMYLHSGVPPNTLVRYRIRATGDSTSYFSSNFGYTSVTTATLDILTTPSLTANVNSNSQITLTINPVPDASAYVLQYGVESDKLLILDTVAANQLTYIHDSLSASSTIFYRAKALGDQITYGNSSYSDVISATTFALPPINAPPLFIDSATSSAVYLRWNAVANATDYLLQWRSDTTLNYELVDSFNTKSLSYIHRTLNPSTKYYYRLQAIADGVNYSNSVFTVDSVTTDDEVWTILQEPTLTAAVTGATTTHESWTAIPGAAYYRLQRSTNNSNWLTILNSTALSFDDQSLKPSTQYWYRVRAIGDSIHTANSPFDKKTITTNALVPLPAPTPFAAVNVSAVRNDLSWNNVNGETQYVIEHSINNTTWDTAVVIAANITSYSDEELNPQTTYYYRITAIGDGAVYGNSTYATATATTPAVTVEPTALTAPVLDANNTGSTTQNVVSWTNVANESGFIVERSTNKIQWLSLSQKAANVLTFNDSPLTPATKYYYRMYAVGDGVNYTNSAYSNIDSATTAALIAVATPNINATPASSTSNTLTWTNSANNRGFTIWTSLNKTVWTVLYNAATNVTTYTDDNLTENTKYYYRIQALGDNVTYTSSGYDIDSATTLPAPVILTQLATPVPTATAISSSQITVNWNNIANESGYKVERSTNNSVWSTVANLGANVTTFTDGSLPSQTRFYYRVTAIGDNVTYSNSNVSNSVNATTQAAISDTTTVVHGVLVNLATVALNKTALANTGAIVLRLAYSGNTANYPAYSNDTKIAYNINHAPPNTNTPVLMPTDSFKFACTADSMFTENGTKNISYIFVINEPNNFGYWSKPVASNYARLLQAIVNVGHRRGIPVFDGGFTGPVVRYMVWEDYKNRGFADSAADYASRAFPGGTQPTNWRTSANYKDIIPFFDTLLNILPTIPTDGVNVHWYEPVIPNANATSIDTRTLEQTFRYYARKTGKPPVSNEYSLQDNSSTNILNQMMSAMKKAKVKIQIYYSGDNALHNADASLKPLGQAYRNNVVQQ